MLQFQEMFQEDEESYYQRLREIAETAEPRDSVKAIELVLAYGRGRPKVTQELVGAGGGPIAIEALSMTTAERAARIEELLAKGGRAPLLERCMSVDEADDPGDE